MQQASSHQEKRAGELKALADVLAVLDGLSNSQVRNVLVMAAAQHGLRVVPAAAPAVVVQQQGPAQPSAQQKGRRKGSVPQAKPENQNPEVRALKAELKALQDRIREASAGQALPESHPLILERNDLLGRITRAKSSFRRPVTGGETSTISEAQNEQKEIGEASS